MIAEFLHFYPAYDLQKALQLYAVTFYSLYSNMYRIKGMDSMTQAQIALVGTSGGDSYSEFMQGARKQHRGIKLYIEEINTLRKVRGMKK